jgi:hypothetical protein
MQNNEQKTSPVPDKDETRCDIKAETKDEMWNRSRDELRDGTNDVSCKESRSESSETSFMKCILDHFHKMSPLEQKQGLSIFKLISVNFFSSNIDKLTN